MQSPCGYVLVDLIITRDSINVFYFAQNSIGNLLEVNLHVYSYLVIMGVLAWTGVHLVVIDLEIDCRHSDLSDLDDNICIEYVWYYTSYHIYAIYD